MLASDPHVTCELSKESQFAWTANVSVRSCVPVTHGEFSVKAMTNERFREIHPFPAKYFKVKNKIIRNLNVELWYKTLRRRNWKKLNESVKAFFTEGDQHG